MWYYEHIAITYFGHVEVTDWFGLMCDVHVYPIYAAIIICHFSADFSLSTSSVTCSYKDIPSSVVLKLPISL